MLIVASRSHPGSVRSTNEDAVLWDETLGLLAVADGMGGHHAGEVASRLAIDAARSFLQKSGSHDDFTWPFGVIPTLSFAANRLMTAVKIANRRVFRAAEEQSDYTGMGTTLVATLVEGGRFCFANVGDSRLYVFESAQLRQISRDDSWVVMLSTEQGLDAEALRKHPMRHVLTNVLGARSEIEVSVSESTVSAGATLMLCSDGLHGAVPEEQMLAILCSEADVEHAADRLVQTALDREGRDNISVLLARYTAD